MTSVHWLDFDDVSQTIRLHIYKKWDQWDPNKTLEPWLNTIITHQIVNILRNLYYNYTRPCLKCAANQGGDLCGITPSQKQCAECPLFKKWERSSKKRALDMKLPVSADDSSELGMEIRNQIESKPQSILDYDTVVPKIHRHMEKILKPLEWKVYKCLFVDFLSEEETAKVMGYKTTEKDRIPGYKRIKKIKLTIVQKAKIAVLNFV